MSKILIQGKITNISNNEIEITIKKSKSSAGVEISEIFIINHDNNKISNKELGKTLTILIE